MRKEYYKQCKWCKRTFWCINEDFFKTQDYCDTKCELDSGYKFIVICGYCGSEIVTRDKRQKYCDADCRKAHQKGRKFIGLGDWKYVPEKQENIDSESI